MKKLVIFDLDGTLCDTLESIAYCTNRALADFGFDSVPRHRVRNFVGNGARTQTIRSLREVGDTESALIDGYTDDDGKNTVPVHLEEVLARYMEYFKVDCMYKVAPYEGILELLGALKEKGVKLAVFSNKPHPNTVSVIREVFGEGIFDVVQGQVPEIQKKPAPDGVYAILERVRQDGARFGGDENSGEPGNSGAALSMEDVLYVGDSGVDMRTGKAANAFTVGVLWGFRDKEELETCGADALIAAPAKLLEYL